MAPTQSDISPRDAADAVPAARGVAIWVILGSGLVALFLGSTALSLVREQLHIGCAMGPPESEGANTWMCSDGVGYVRVAASLGAMWFLATLLGALVAGLVRRERAARIALVGLAAVATASILGWTYHGSSELVLDEYIPMTGTDYWHLSVGPAAIACGVGLLAAFVSLLLPGRLGRVLCAGAAGVLLTATVLQPGLSLNVIPAAGLLAAASIRSTGSAAGR